PRKEIPFCGMAAFICWLTYQLVTRHNGTAFLGTLLATCAATTFSRILSNQRRQPTIVYHLPGILPLVPGAAVYHCITSAMEGGALNTTINILTAFKLAGAIGIGSVIVLVLPAKWFSLIPSFGKKSA
ncbi:MAG: threonine/serine exporter family protein, partial [Bacillota bacterium]|nr:threonine/serine exporter family protein [Bacillota bacterium]